jgi:predicted phosphodiesterase
VLIGILSDTHDRLDNAVAGLNLLRDAGAEFYIHCGDVGGEQILDQFAGLPAALVWGNNDWDRRSLERYAKGLEIAVYPVLADRNWTAGASRSRTAMTCGLCDKSLSGKRMTTCCLATPTSRPISGTAAPG